jgi:hypothetical protein
VYETAEDIATLQELLDRSYASAGSHLLSRHIKARPQVSVTHVRGEELAVTVHGFAREVDTKSERAHGYRDLLVEIYGDRGMTDANWDSDGGC